MTSTLNNLYTLGPYLITYDTTMKTETFSEASYHGIIFITSEARYQLINNYHLGTRLIINPHDGGCQDIPFKPATFVFLPEGVGAHLISEGLNNVSLAFE
jgi:hypothetical protein